ncbi:MAG TPA: DUF1214 domain-containing protein [Kaistiaceae bacterium]|nr:DUF1214 domain-containing protein [Kaistiaceae bacterium]
MRFLFNLSLASAIALVIGLGLTYLAIEHGRLLGVVHSGEWTAWPQAGRFDADPYTRAKLTRTGEIPLGAGEGLAFTTSTDAEGVPLDPLCEYIVAGRTPAARLWTLTVYSATGQLLATDLGRTGFSSREVVRRPDGSFEIVLAPMARPGNWIQTAPGGKIMLALRVYDTPLTTGADFTDLTLPHIIRGRCR